MKRILSFMTGLFFFCFLINIVYSACTRETPCCCQEYPGGEKKCFTEGFCCYVGEEREFWNPISCFDFTVWVEPTRSMFTVGSKTRINLYIKNLGYADNYYVTHNITSDNPHLIQVDMTGVSPVNDVAYEETRIVYPGITVLESHTTGVVFFNVTSETNMNVSRNATLTILEGGDLPLSLPEFDFFGLIAIIFLASYLYFRKRK